MVPIGVFPSLALVIGAACGASLDVFAGWLPAAAACLLLCAVICYGLNVIAARQSRLGTVVLPCVAAAALCTGARLAADARDQALHTPLRAVLERHVGGFRLEDIAVPGEHDPIQSRALIVEDAWSSPAFTTLRVRVRDVRLGGAWQAADGGVTLSVGGAIPPATAAEWTTGRAIEVPVIYRRPARYLNTGVVDFERDMALDGTTLFGSVKSGRLIDLRARGTAMQELAARARRHVRRTAARWVGRHDPVSSAIVTAVLIGDRTGLPDDIRLRLQAAGTYHVIAISGGNIAILAACGFWLLKLCGGAGRLAAFGTLLLLVGYAQIVAAGPSVWRATVMAVVYLVARMFDHRTPPWQGLAIAAIVATWMRPLDVRDPGFLLTFGATAALLEVARRLSVIRIRSRGLRWLVAAIAASLAAEIALLPISATTFSRVTGAGLVLNLLAIPLMGVTQIAGMAAVGLDVVTRTLPAPRGVFEPVAWFFGWLAHLGAAGIVISARLVELAPWLTARVPPPSTALIVTYYTALGLVLLWPGLLRRPAAAMLVLTALAIVTGCDPVRRLADVTRRRFEDPVSQARSAPQVSALRLTMFDVGQAESMLLEFPDRSSLMVDTGGAPFGGGGFDIGGRVLAPALWARGVRSLGALLLTHGDPDHIGGAAAMLGDFKPAWLREGIPVPSHAGLRAVHDLAQDEGVALEELRAGQSFVTGGVHLRVLHPPPPDWERQKVRNDDSVVVELVYGDVALLLTGDAGADVERSILPHLTPARVRLLKVGHHGSRTSTSPALLDAWRPTIALISAGRGNRFGHPAADVIARLHRAGARIYRTDRDGQITVTTDGHDVRVRTYVGEKR